MADRQRGRLPLLPRHDSRRCRLAGRPVLVFAIDFARATDQGDGRVDYRLSDKDSLFGSISWSNTSKSLGPIFPGALDGSPFNGAGEDDLSRNAQMSYTRVWSPRLISETRVGFTRLVTSRIGLSRSTCSFENAASSVKHTPIHFCGKSICNVSLYS